MKRKEKVGIITFHASHNYGSMLQAYALQQTILNMGYDCEIINFRTFRQKNYYRPEFLRGALIGQFNRILLYLPFIFPLWKKHCKFEQFLNEKFRLSSKEYTTEDELKLTKFKYDIYISGSDQIWNPLTFDFDFAYLLPFAGDSKRISYAPSMGPNPDIDVFLNSETKTKIKELLDKYDCVSVRERQTQEQLYRQYHVRSVVTIDPTLLLGSAYWSRMAGDEPLVKGKYIFLYAPRYYDSVHAVAEQLSRKFNLPIVVSLLYSTRKGNLSMMFKSVHFKLATGPIEFLNLCKFATYTIGLSFHLIVFSILLRIPFYAIDGMNDSRIRDLLILTGLTSRSVCNGELNDVTLCPIDFDTALKNIAKARCQSVEWLKKSMSNNSSSYQD